MHAWLELSLSSGLGCFAVDFEIFAKGLYYRVFGRQVGECMGRVLGECSVECIIRVNVWVSAWDRIRISFKLRTCRAFGRQVVCSPIAESDIGARYQDCLT